MRHNTYSSMRFLGASVLLMLAISGCGGGDETVRSNPQPKQFPIPGETVAITKPDKNPIGHVLELLGLAETDLVRPLYYEEGYIPLCRNPLIDRLAESPFYLHHWADETSFAIQESAETGLCETVSAAMRILNGGVSYPLPERSGLGMAQAYTVLCTRHNAQPDMTVIEEIGSAGFTDAFDKQLGAFAASVGDAALLAKTAVASLDPNEIEYLSALPERYFYDGIVFSFLTAPTHVQKRISDMTRKIDFVSLFTSALIVSRAVDDFSDFVSENPGNYFRDGKERTGMVLNVESPIGNIVVLGQGDDNFSGDAAMTIDLGGNDTYSGPIAVGHRVAGRVSVAVDADGNDTYSSPTRQFSQGFGCLAVGILADLKGNDKYLAADMAQGCGIYGVGLIADFEGRDHYGLGSMGQGFGVFGLGLLIDKNGDDLYTITALGQGTGSTMGLGLLCDASGNDRYFADKGKKVGYLMPGELCHVQGAGLSVRHPGWTEYPSLYGGIGFLTDKSGDDRYVASHGNCMGSSYFMSLGALVDHDGNDIYMPNGGYGLCYAVHLSSAVFIDRNGNDYYYGTTHTGGVGSDRSGAIMADYDGNDTYGPTKEDIRAKIVKEAKKRGITIPADKIEKSVAEALPDVSFGVGKKPKGLGFLIDYKGDDRYFGKNKGWAESCGGTLPPQYPDEWNHAALADLSGTDFYLKEGRQNNHYFRYYEHGLCYDTEYSGNGFPGKQKPPPVTRLYNKPGDIPGILDDGIVGIELAGLLSPDLFVRYKAIGNIVRKMEKRSSFPIGLLAVSVDIELNRDLIEIVRLLALNADPEYAKQFGTLFFAADPAVRIFAARIAGWRRLKSAQESLSKAMGENDGIVRSNIIWALGKIGSDDTIPRLIDIARTDKDADCRRKAMAALFEKRGKSAHRATILETFLKISEDPDTILRYLAASGLSDFGKDDTAMAVLANLLRDPDVYVRRAASHALIVNGKKEAVPNFIDTLEFPSVDTFENYDRELANDLAFFCGVDFPKDKRYDYKIWKTWWEENGSTVDLSRNVAVMRDIQNAFKMPNELDGIAVFDRLMKENSENAVVKIRYIRFCNDWIHFRLLKMANVSEAVLERCVRLQKIICEKEPESAVAKSMLAYLYARLSKIDDAVSTLESAIKLEPNNSSFRNSLKEYKKMKSDG